ncbi:MAG: DUF1611 domain-containing protein [Actinomycetota bacterium]
MANASSTPLSPSRRRRLKRAYTTNQVPIAAVAGLFGMGKPRPGDLIVARVAEIRAQQRLELTNGRRALLHEGDEILVAYGHRYAPSQYEAYVPESLEPCELVAAGGVAAVVASCNEGKAPATIIEPLGFVVDDTDRRVNLEDWCRPPAPLAQRRPTTIVVTGTSMDSGKTTAAAALIHGLTRSGRRVGAAKVTGTGAGGDVWRMADAGADPVLDFTAAGMASTYLADDDAIGRCYGLLLGHLGHQEVEVAVIEIADGLFQRETAHLLASPRLRLTCDGIIFAAREALGAAAGVDRLRDLDLPVLAVSGLLSASPLARREAEGVVDLPVLGREELQHHPDRVLRRCTPAVAA